MATTARVLTASMRRAAVPAGRQVTLVRFLQGGKDVGTPNSPDKTITTVEPGELKVSQADAVSGAPEFRFAEELRERTVRIFRPARTASQQGTNGTRLWRIDFDILEGGSRWENPLMGWASSADYQQALSIKFKTKEDAVRFAERQGWNYYVQEPKENGFRKKLYADNFKHVPGKLRLIKTK